MEQPASLGAVRSFLVAIDGSPASMRALESACEVASRSHARVAALHVIEVPRALPLEAELTRELERGEAILSAAEAQGRRLDVAVEGRILQGRQAGVALVDEAQELGSDAIVIGVDYHRPYGKFELDDAARYVLENAHTEVWLIRYPPAAGHAS